MTERLRSQPPAYGGFTLVETMIALVIGMLIMLALSKIFLSNSEGFRVQTGMARIQENARFVIDQIKRDVGQAGFPGGIVSPAFVVATTTDGAGTDPDTLTITYDVGAPALGGVDCIGNAGTLQNPPHPLWPGLYLVTNRYSLSAPDANGLRSLMCNNVVLVDGVDNMQFLYGVDTDVKADGAPNVYVNATQLSANVAPVLWTKVVSVRVALLINTVETITDAGRDPLETKTYTLLDAPTLGPFTDRRGRQVFNTTFMLRNVIL